MRQHHREAKLLTMSDGEPIKIYWATQFLTVVFLFTCLNLGLLPALLGGLLVFQLVEMGALGLARVGIIPHTSKIILLILITLVTISLIALGIFGAIAQINHGPESIVLLFQKMADVVEAGRSHLPAWAYQYLPNNIEEMQSATSSWLRENAGKFSAFGQEAGIFLIRLIIGMVIGGMVAINLTEKKNRGPLAESLVNRASFLDNAFRRIVFSQVRISAINTALTAVFIAGVLPLTGNPLPFTKTMIAVTFVVGLLPVVGNLISNTVIFLISLSVSAFTAISALLYLIIIHKFEYFLNAHIIGSRIKSRPWEVLVAMLVMEAAFGIKGLVAAPIFYAYIRDELSAKKLV